MNKFDSSSGVGKSFNLLEEYVYQKNPDVNGYFTDEKGNIIAHRETLELTQNSIYKTQFSNPLLRKALQPLNENTKFIFYDEKGIVNTIGLNPKLNEGYSSIVCEREPLRPFLKVSLVIYTGSQSNEVFLNNGLTTMTSDYKPTKSTDVVTKNYLDNKMDEFISSNSPLKNFSINQYNIYGYCYTDNKQYPVILYRKYSNHEELDNCNLTIDEFILKPTFSENTLISLVNERGTRFYTEKLKDIINNNSTYWKLTSTKNVYAEATDQIYWKNSYAITFNPKDFNLFIDSSNPIIGFYIELKDGSLYETSDIFNYGFDEYINNIEGNINLSWNENSLSTLKTKYTSGIKYFIEDSSIIYNLPIEITIKNNFLQYFRNDVNVILNTLKDNKEINNSYNLSIGNHRPLSDNFTFRQNINFTIKDKYLEVNLYNVKKEKIYSKIINLGTDTDTTDETKRVTTPSAQVLYPTIDYGNPWDSSKELEEWEMKARNNNYTCKDRENSALCFKYVPNDCYSNITLNADTDGIVFIKSQGNTGWLSTSKKFVPFNIPTKNDEGILVNNNYFTFGKVIYKSPVFIRIIKATYFNLKNISLS